MTITTDVENYPGFADVIQGPWLMEQMQTQAENVGVEMFPDIIVEADLLTTPFKLKGDGGNTYSCDSLIISTGAQAKWLGLESEQKYQGFGEDYAETDVRKSNRYHPWGVPGSSWIRFQEKRGGMVIFKDAVI